MVTRVLVVDDSTVSREVVSRILTEVLDGAEITACGSGEEALRAVDDNSFSLVTTALKLPDMDGLDLSRRVRSNEQHHLTPIVVISCGADTRLLDEGFAAGVTDYFDESEGYRAFGDFIKNVYQLHSALRGRILYVEDSRTAALVTRKVLEKYGLEIEHVESAEQASSLLEKCDQSECEYDLVITDFNLKGRMSGGDLLHLLRVHLHYTQQELPVLVVTGNEDSQTQSEVFQAGANDFVCKPIVEEILMARVRLLLLIKHQFDTLKGQAETMERMAITDTLTGVYNRRYLTEQCDAMMAEPENRPLWALLIDLDHFKRINDTHGHLTGDQVLAATGRLLRENFPDGVAVRFGGEEFAVILPSSSQSHAVRRAESFRRQIALLRPQGVPVTTSMGLACADHHPVEDLDRLRALADEALYAAKEGGRNRICVMDARSEVVPLRDHGIAS